MKITTIMMTIQRVQYSYLGIFLIVGSVGIQYNNSGKFLAI